MRIGFTGTQNGMTDQQRRVVALKLSLVDGQSEFHHGCCVGADEQASWLAVAFNFVIVEHPPINKTKISTNLPEPDKKVGDKDYLDRNHDIVDMTERLIATPKGFHEEQRSGTWATIRYAQRNHKPVTIIWPDGTTKEIKA